MNTWERKQASKDLSLWQLAKQEYYYFRMEELYDWTFDCDDEGHVLGTRELPLPIMWAVRKLWLPAKFTYITGKYLVLYYVCELWKGHHMEVLEEGGPDHPYVDYSCQRCGKSGRHYF